MSEIDLLGLWWHARYSSRSDRFLAAEKTVETLPPDHPVAIVAQRLINTQHGESANSALRDRLIWQILRLLDQDVVG